ncbi:hypothetical protein JTB14_012315 [Gonioctena quinquepunctata]|nr:hypothetical protein JTB14_012315 [Gonioctena quinquepunctata]
MIKATYSFLTEPLLHKYLEYLLNREDSEESLREYMKDCCEFNVLFNVGIGKPLVERRIMLKMCELFPDLMEGETEKFQKGVQFLIENLVNFSIANVEYCVILSDFPYLVSFIKDLFSKEKTFDHGISCLLGKVIRYQIHFPQYAIIEKSRIFELILHAVKHKGCAWPYTEILKEWICRKDRSDFNEVSALYLKELFEVSPENNIIIWLLKNEPESLVPYFEKILQKIPLNRSKGFGKELKLYSHFDFDSKAADFYGKQLEQKKCEKKREILKILVELLSTDQFVELVNDHLLPQKDKIELQDKKMRKIYSWQFEVSKILHEVHEPYKVLLLVMKFSIGDYLQSVLTSLYGVFYKSPEKLLHPHVEVLEKRGLSTRKHAVFLSCEVLDKKYALERLETAKQSEVVSSKHLFSAVLKYFKKNPSQELIQMINLILPKIDMYDSETFGIITSLTVPNKYKSVFIVNYWNFFHHLKVEEDKKVSNYLQKLLDHISADILKSLSSDFIHFLIYSYLGSKELAGFERFVLKILEYRESERNHNFPFVFKELSVQKKTLSSFLRCFIDLPKENEEIDRDFVNTFVRYWNGYFPILGNCREHVALKLFLLRLDHRTTEELAQKICIYLEELSSEFGPHIFMLFKTEFEALIDKMEKAEKYILFHNILKYKCTTFTCILVLDFIDLVDLDEENLEIMQYYASIIGRVKQVDEPIVHIYYKSYFNTCDLAM